MFCIIKGSSWAKLLGIIDASHPDNPCSHFGNKRIKTESGILLNLIYRLMQSLSKSQLAFFFPQKFKDYPKIHMEI